MGLPKLSQIDNFYEIYKENYLLMWDLLTDESVVYVPVIVINEDNKKKYQLFVDFSQKVSDDRLTTNVFFSKKEATSFKDAKKHEGLSFAKMELKNLYKSLSNFFNSNKSSEFNCVLSTLDTDGKIRDVVEIWSNKIDC